MINKSEYDVYTKKMEASLSYLEEEFGNIRAGRANPAILNKLTVEYYGVPTPITQVGSVSVPEPRMLMFQPYDMSILKEVEKAIFKSDIGITPNNDGKVIRLVFPPLTEERSVTLSSRMVMFLHLESRSRIRLPEVGAQVPFSISATVRFCRLCATISCSAVSMLTKMPAL